MAVPRHLSLPPPQIRAWFSYAVGSEIYVSCTAMFVPIMLEKMAREIGYVAPELVDRCVGHEQLEESTEQVCRVQMLGAWVDTASFSMYVRSISVIVQAISIISVGALADSDFWRKNLLVFGGFMSALNTAAIFFLPRSSTVLVLLLAALLSTVAYAAYAVAGVCNNAFLPILVRDSKDVLAASKVDNGQEDVSTLDEREDEEARTLLPRSLEDAVLSTSVQDLAQFEAPSGRDHHQRVLSLAMSRLSSMGSAVSTGAGLSGMVISAVPTALMGGTVYSMQLVMGISGICYAAFVIPALIGLPGGIPSTQTSKFGWLGQGWRKAGTMVRPSEMRALPNVFKYLLAWTFLSDGFHTINYTSILYASSTLHMPPARVIIIGALLFLTATLSSVYVPHLQRRLGYTNLKLLVWIVVLAQVVPLYGTIGLVLPFGGLRTEAEMYVAAAWTGILHGPWISYSRAVYAELIPPGHETSFFSLFALTDKSSSFFGPFAIGLIADLTGNIRLGFLVLSALLAAPLPIIMRVNVQRGAEEARAWADKHKLSPPREPMP